MKNAVSTGCLHLLGQLRRPDHNGRGRLLSSSLRDVMRACFVVFALLMPVSAVSASGDPGVSELGEPNRILF